MPWLSKVSVARPNLPFPVKLWFPQSLQKIVGEVQSKVDGPLNRRLNLARFLAQAVLSVHTAGFVHKNTRPETILIFQRQKNSSVSSVIDETNDDVPVLTEWQMLRRVNDTSSRRGEGDWDENVYRHPERQGIKPEARYNMGHDIYSLGVCLLEIGFWKPLVVRHGNEGEASTNDLSPTFREAVHSLDSSMINDESSLQNLAKPVFVRQAILQLTRQNLPLSL